jgi:uncharacterized protein
MNLLAILTVMRPLHLGLTTLALAVFGFLLMTTGPVQSELSTTGSFGGVSLMLEYATTPEARELGLGGREHVPEGSGMLFAFPKDDFYGFWMKDTLVPLDIFWLDDKGQVVSIAADVATSTYPHVFYPAHAARYVLETASGFARTHHVTAGEPLLLKNFPIVSK